MQMAIFTLDPKEVLTTLGANPSEENIAVKFCINPIRGLSSAITTHVRSEVRETFFSFIACTCCERCLVHNSITGYEHIVSRTLYWL